MQDLPKAPVYRNIFIQKNISQASFRTIFCNDANVWDFDGASDKLSQVRMI